MNKFIIIINPISSTSDQLEDINKRIKEYGCWAKLSNTSYLVCTNNKASEVRDSILNWLNSDSNVYVFYFDSGHACYAPDNINNWIRSHFI